MLMLMIAALMDTLSLSVDATRQFYARHVLVFQLPL